MTGLPDSRAQTIYSTKNLARETTNFGVMHLSIDGKQKELKKFLV
jgi:hypothetical protein